MTEYRTEESKRNTEIQGAYAEQPNNKSIDGNKNGQAERTSVGFPFYEVYQLAVG
jgi:hypothetical protein